MAELIWTALLVGTHLGLLALMLLFAFMFWRLYLNPPCEHDWQPTGKTWTSQQIVGGPGPFGELGDVLNIEERCSKCNAEQIGGGWV